MIVLSGYMPRSRIAGLYSSSIFSLRTPVLLSIWIVEMKSTAADKYRTTYDDLLDNTNLLGIGNIQRDNLLFLPLSRLPYVFD